MISLRFQTYRRAGTWAALLIILSFAMGIVVRAPWAGFVSSALFWFAFVFSVGMGLTVAILRKLGRLEFIYTEKDRYSYIYNAERQDEQRRAARKARREGRDLNDG